MKHLLTRLALLTFALPFAAAQGPDCSAPVALAGLGTFAFNTTGMTSSGFNGGGSCSSGANSVNQDGFFLWTAPASGAYQFDTNGTAWDTKLAIHSGSGCAASCIGYDDDGGTGFQSEIYVTGLVGGQPYLIQVGGYGNYSGPGVLNIQSDPCGGTDGLEDNDTCQTAWPVVPGTYTGLIVTAADPDFYEVMVPAGYRLDVATFATNAANTDVRTFDLNCNFIQFPNEPFHFQNTTAAPILLRWEVKRAAFSSEPCSVYDMDVALGPDVCQTSDVFDPNDSCQTAAVLGTGTYTGLIVSTPDRDFYRVDVPPGQILQVSWQSSNGTDLDMDLHIGACGLGTAVAGNFFHVNTGTQPEMVVFEPYNTTWQFPCSEYSLDVYVGPNPCNAPDDAYEPNNSCATATPMGNGTYPGLVCKQGNDDDFSFTVDAGATVTCGILFADITADLDIYLYEASNVACGTNTWSQTLDYGLSTTDDEWVTWTNTTGAPVDLVLEVDFWGEGLQTCNTYDLVIAGTGTGQLSTFCDPANSNSTGAPTMLSGTVGTGSGSGLRLEASGGPVDQFGYFLVGDLAVDPGLPVSQGRLCVSGQIGRYNLTGASTSVGRFNVFGVLINQVGTSSTGTGFDVPVSLPFAGNPSIAAGDTWYFQLWHRENGGQANFSNGLAVTF
ncbi:MAG: hypothetical protein R3F33_10940 [Planctomycetota bacterium]